MSGSSARFIERFQDLFGTSTDSNVFRQIYPANCPSGIDKKFGRATNVRSLGSRAPMQEIVMPNDFRLWIREEGKRISQLLPLPPIDLRCVNADRDHANATRVEVRKPLLETPQLGVT